MYVLTTERLALRRLSPDDDAKFILELLNDPGWLRYIGDRNVRTLEDARGYIVNGPGVMYEKYGFGLFLVERKEDGIPIGLCGLLRRDTLDAPDIGYAFLPDWRGKGYAYEAAAAVMRWGRETFGMTRIVAITSPDNDISGRLLEKLGLRCEGLRRLEGGTSDVKFWA